eukprot:TRINITY_DN8542_c0_g1_i1.p1 TRINITY_DN8542_c0_g1~~TRINITY_DN8542_c0_g1_i1.p1  ORF type:complete len:165 (+),score=5.41 TRINITY_DN8542_c0_g1_i1:22-516(+)
MLMTTMLQQTEELVMPYFFKDELNSRVFLQTVLLPYYSLTYYDFSANEYVVAKANASLSYPFLFGTLSPDGSYYLLGLETGNPYAPIYKYDPESFETLDVTTFNSLYLVFSSNDQLRLCMKTSSILSSSSQSPLRPILNQPRPSVHCSCIHTLYQTNRYCRCDL